MKKLISLALAAILAAGTLASCAVPADDSAESAVSFTSSEAQKYADWLDERLDDAPAVTLGIGSADEYGIDMNGFTDDGYIIRTVGDTTVAIGKTADGLDRAVRAFAKAVEGGQTGGFDVVWGEGPRVKRLTIGGVDISEYSIYMDCADDACHTLAANDLRNYIGKACGYYPEISDVGAGNLIILEQVLPGDERYETLGDEGFTISVDEYSNLRIAGGQYRGCLFGVYEFLEKYVGWRFLYDYYNMEDYSSDYEAGCIDYLYEAEHVDVPAGTNDTQTPGVGSRRMIKTLTDNGAYGYRVKDNYHLSTSASVQKKFNGYGIRHIASHGIVDGPYKDFVDYDKSLYSQPCFTNEENIEIAIEYYTNYVREKLASGAVVGKDFLEVDVAQLDASQFCTCSSCAKYIKSEGGYVGPVLYFTNRIAEAVAEVCPDVYVQMLAYMGTTSVPKTMKPLDNVSVSYCFFTDINPSEYFCNNHPLDGSECEGYNNDGHFISNKNAADELRGWTEICDHVTVWYYPGNWNFTAISTSLLRNTYYDMQFLMSFDIDCLFSCPAAYSNIMGYNRPEEMFVPFMLARLAWNPHVTYEEYLDMVEEYFYVICGDGAEEILQYLQILETCEPDNCYSTISYSDECLPHERISYGLYAEKFETMIALFDEAMRKADTEWQEKYIEEMSLGMYLTGLAATHEDWYVNGTDAERAKYTEYYEYFKSTALEYDFFIHGFIEEKVYLTEDHFNIEENPEKLAYLGKEAHLGQTIVKK